MTYDRSKFTDLCPHVDHKEARGSGMEQAIEISEPIQQCSRHIKQKLSKKLKAQTLLSKNKSSSSLAQIYLKMQWSKRFIDMQKSGLENPQLILYFLMAIQWLFLLTMMRSCAKIKSKYNIKQKEVEIVIKGFEVMVIRGSDNLNKFQRLFWKRNVKLISSELQQKNNKSNDIRPQAKK